MKQRDIICGLIKCPLICVREMSQSIILYECVKSMFNTHTTTYAIYDSKILLPIFIIQKMSIQEFFTGRNVLVTGATGFMGKVLIEKLVRSCPGIGQICVLLRQKKGKGTDRIKEILDAQVSFLARCMLKTIKIYTFTSGT